jgi:adenylyltransferase/sulfurtransferase
MPNCAEGGVLGVLPAQVGSIQATETLKLLLGIGEPLLGRLLTLDALGMRFDEFRIKKDDQCAVCGKHPTIKTVQEAALACDVPPAAEHDAKVEELSVDQLDAWRRERKDHVLVDVRTAEEAAICRIEGALLIPMATLDQALDRIPRDKPVVIHCKSGARSARAVAQLKAKGYGNTFSLSGGILAWIKAKAPDLATY